MFKPRTIWGWIRYFIAPTEEYSNGEIVERGIRIGTRNRELILAVPTDTPGIIIRYLSADDEQMCDVGWEVSLSLWLPSVAWGHGPYRKNSGYFRGEYYNFGYMFDNANDVGWYTLAVKPWRNFCWFVTKRRHSTSDDFTPPPNDSEIPF